VQSQSCRVRRTGTRPDANVKRSMFGEGWGWAITHPIVPSETVSCLNHHEHKRTKRSKRVDHVRLESNIYGTLFFIYLFFYRYIFHVQ
jgi:hypothetical protein